LTAFVFRISCELSRILKRCSATGRVSAALAYRPVHPNLSKILRYADGQGDQRHL
jgi:hypothetical protein